VPTLETQVSAPRNGVQDFLPASRYEDVSGIMTTHAGLDETGPNQKRREARYPLQTNALFERRTGEQIAGSTVNISGSGVLLDLAEDSDLKMGEEVGCSIQLYPDKPLQAWGVGKVVRVDSRRVAIEFTGLDWDA
jgi:hypothetical protein